MKRSHSLWRRHRSVPIAVGAVVALGLAACGSSSSSTGATGGGSTAQCSNIPAGPIKIANIVPLSGPTATAGELLETESTVMANYFNAHDSICGHQIQIANYNDKGDPATSLNIARQLVAQGETIIGQDSYSSPQNQIQPYLMQQHVLVVANNGAYALLNPQNSLDGAKLAAAIEQIKGLQLDIPGIQDSFSATDHTGWPNGELKECTLKAGPYDILYAAS